MLGDVWWFIYHRTVQNIMTWALNLRRKILFYLEIQMFCKRAVFVFYGLFDGLFHTAIVPSEVLLHDHN